MGSYSASGWSGKCPFTRVKLGKQKGGNDAIIGTNNEDSDDEPDTEEPRIIPYSQEHRDLSSDSDQSSPIHDRIVTGWDPIQPLAGHKRAHSPEGEIIRTKRGREVKRVDYHCLHH